MEFYISIKNGAIATKRKANIAIDLKASIMTIWFDFGHDLDLEFSRSNMEFAISLPKIPPGAVFCGGCPKMVALTGV